MCLQPEEQMTDPNADLTAPLPEFAPDGVPFAQPEPPSPAFEPVPSPPSAPPAAPLGSPVSPGFIVGPAPMPAAPPASARSGSGSGGYGKWLVALLIPVLAIVTFAGGVATGRSGVLGDTGAAASTQGSNGANAHIALIDEAWRTIHENYVDAKNLDDQKMTYAAIRALTEAVGDEGHTSFFTAEESKAVDQSLSGTFVGIGVQVNSEDDTTKGPTISSVIPNTPAEKANLKRGDRIVSVDGWTTAGHTVDEVVSRVRGPEG